MVTWVGDGKTRWRGMSQHSIMVQFTCPKCGLQNELLTGRSEVGEGGKVQLLCAGCKHRGATTLQEWGKA